MLLLSITPLLFIIVLVPLAEMSVDIAILVSCGVPGTDGVDAPDADSLFFSSSASATLERLPSFHNRGCCLYDPHHYQTIK
jgi:hypothetical protein